MPIFRYPFFYNNYPPYYNNPYRPTSNNANVHTNNANSSQPIHNTNYNTLNSQNFNINMSSHHSKSQSPCFPSDEDKKNSADTTNDSDYFFELFGLKLYFDDILLICLIFFLYEEGVKDDELFISLILLLLS